MPTRRHPSRPPGSPLVSLALVLWAAACSAGLSDGLVASWNFDTGFAASSGGPQFDATPMGDQGLPVIDPEGRFGGAARFSRDHAQYAVVDTPLITPGQDHTYSAWYRTTIPDIQTGDLYYVLESYPNYSMSYRLENYAPHDDMGHVYTTWAGGSPHMRIPGAAGTVWHNIIVTYDSSEALHVVYLDGLELSPTLNSSSVLAATDGLYFGAHRTLAHFWDGWIDDVGVWDRVLTAAEITEAQTRAVVPEFSDAAAGLPDVSNSAAAWGDYDGDGDLDILLTGDLGPAAIARLYRNDGGAFTDAAVGLEGVCDAAAAWGDHDNDGDLDILLTGSSLAGPISRIYRNDGGVFTDAAAGLEGVWNSSVSWGDHDDDGDLDILLTGTASAGRISRIYRNDGGAFTDAAAGLVGVDLGSVAWADPDNDGDLDILLSGQSDSGPITRLYMNDGGGFTTSDAALEAVSSGSVAWGDQDNDGDLDILLTGNSASGRCARVYRNDGGVFTDIVTALEGVNYGCVDWGDYDDDGDLDILLTGAADAGGVSRVYRNERGGAANTPPTAPTTPSGRLVGTTLRLAWGAATDAETHAYGLTYNIRVGTSPGGSEICSAHADPSTGLRRIPRSGNARQRMSWVLHVPAGGVYYWSVQALDASYAGSPFTSEQTTCETFRDIGAELPGVSQSSGTSWSDFDGDGDLDVLVTGYSNSGPLTCVYRNEGGDFRIHLTHSFSFYAGDAGWGDLDNDGDQDYVITGQTGYSGLGLYTVAERNDGDAFVSIDFFSGLTQSSVDLGDCDNDGDLDLLLTGWNDTGPNALLYLNDGGTFSQSGVSLPGIYRSCAAWGDYDDDGDLDIILAGCPILNYPFTWIYRNDDGAFTQTTSLLGVQDGSVAWGDHDGDGDLDILLTGQSLSGPVALIYENDGAGGFADLSAGLEGVTYSEGAWGDYDNDGDLDVLLAGNSAHGRITRVYRNEGGTFVDIAAGLPGVSDACANWGDYDGDGVLDILLSGFSDHGRITSVLRGMLPISPNTPPSAPTALVGSLDGTTLSLSWNAADDAETPPSALSYNIRVGTTPGGSEIVSAQADPTTGLRHIPQLGNAQMRTAWELDVPAGGSYFWSVQAVDAGFAGSPFGPERETFGPSTGVSDQLPTAFALYGNVPNPFNPRTTILFDLPDEVPVRLEILDLAGRRIRALMDGRRVEAGRHRVTWNGCDDRGLPVPAGVYLSRVEAGAARDSRHMVLVK